MAHWNSRSAVVILGGLAGIALVTNIILNKKLRQHERDDGAESAPPRMIAFGDSVTQYGFDAEKMGWLAQVCNVHLRLHVIMLDRLFKAGAAQPTALVTVFLGINDAVLPGEKQHVPLPEYRANMNAIVNHLRTAYPDAAKRLMVPSQCPSAPFCVQLVLIAPAPVHLGKWEAHRAKQGRPLDRSQEHTLQYARACLALARDMGVPAVDLHTALGSGDQELADKYLHDGLHLSAEGNAVLFTELQRTILAAYPHLDPDTMKMQAPWHGHVDEDSPEESILRDL
ncbi:SGNH hydrolase-type esterase domain-containing protein [Tribonema minus]|uniref:SGNH hydrolase-type esterase domain-containing protein n=1 Tax=Tribonema minus TaxID=303371 RepID=A0A836CKV6_9STRA|nr:SGNH hydrolase-type esterase domain-containing protein [Tribonema minus]